MLIPVSGSTLRVLIPFSGSAPRVPISFSGSAPRVLNSFCGSGPGEDLTKALDNPNIGSGSTPTWL